MGTAIGDSHLQLRGLRPFGEALRWDQLSIAAIQIMLMRLVRLVANLAPAAANVAFGFSGLEVFDRLRVDVPAIETRPPGSHIHTIRNKLIEADLTNRN